MPIESSDFSIMLSQLLVLAALATALAAATDRLCRSPLLGGLIAGLLLSAAVGGQWLPGVYDRLFIGGDETSQQIDELAAERAETREVLTSTGVTPVAVEEFDLATEAELQPLRERLDEQQKRYTNVNATLTMALVMLWIAMAATARVDRLLVHMRDAMPLAMGALVGVALLATVGATMLGRMTAGDEAAAWFAGLLIVCMTAAVPIRGELLAPMHTEGSESLDDRAGVTQAAALLLTLIAFVALALVGGAGGAGGEAGSAMNAGDALASMAVLAVMIFAVNPLLRRWGSLLGGLAVVLMIAALLHVFAGLPVAIVALAIGLGSGWVSIRRSDAEQMVPGTVFRIVTPIVGAALAMRVSFVDFSWWLLLVVLIAAGDGKAMATWVLGKLFGGRTWGGAFAMAGAIAIGGLMPVALGYVLLVQGMIDESLYAAAVVATIVMELVVRPLTAMMDDGAIAAEPRR